MDLGASSQISLHEPPHNLSEHHAAMGVCHDWVSLHRTCTKDLCLCGGSGGAEDSSRLRARFVNCKNSQYLCQWRLEELPVVVYHSVAPPDVCRTARSHSAEWDEWRCAVVGPSPSNNLCHITGAKEAWASESIGSSCLNEIRW